MLIWYIFSLGNFHTLTWGFLSNLHYAYIIAILTCVSWLFNAEKKRLPLTPVVILTLLFSLWMTSTDIPDLTKPRATHSIYLDVLSEHGYVGLALFLMIGLYSWLNCSWLVRHSRDRPDLAWADQLGRMGHGVLVAYWTAGAFASQAYLDEYWCVVFLFDAARRIVAKEASGAFDGASSVRLRERHGGVSALVRKSHS